MPAPLAVRVDNEYGVIAGSNLANHTASLAGFANFVLVSSNTRAVQFRTKQAAYRHAAYLIVMADTLPDDAESPHTFDEVLTAVKDHLEQ